MSPSTLFAGMPSVKLTEVATLRLEVISFFFVAFLASALVLRWVWNGLAKDFPRLPRLGYGRALGIVAIWGSLFVLVLTMISGARELMTPGAWKTDGLTYRLADGEKSVESDGTTAERTGRLHELRFALWAYADRNGGVLPESRDTSAVPARLWVVPHPSGVRYQYVPGRRVTASPGDVVALEPDLFPNGRFVLLSDGTVTLATRAEIARAEKGNP